MWQSVVSCIFLPQLAVVRTQVAFDGLRSEVVLSLSWENSPPDILFSAGPSFTERVPDACCSGLYHLNTFLSVSSPGPLGQSRKPGPGSTQFTAGETEAYLFIQATCPSALPPSPAWQWEETGSSLKSPGPRSFSQTTVRE